MTCEVCPFCGKTYKRLKSHLPHCKAAAASKAPPSKPDVTANQTASSSQLDSVLSRATTKGRKSSSSVITDLQGQTRKRDTASGPSNATSSSPRTSSSMTLLSPTTKKKLKLVDQIKTSTLLLSPSPALPPTTSKPKKKSLRALIEAAKCDQIKKESLKVSETEPTVSSRNTAQTEPKTISGKDYAHLSADTKPKDAPKKTPKTKNHVNQMLATTKQSESSTKFTEKSHKFWEDGKQEIEDSSMNNFVLKLGNGHQAKITLQDVKATLGRARPPRQSSRPSILSQIQTNDNLSSKIGVDTGVGPVPLLEDNQKYVATQSDELLSTSPQHAGLKSDKKIPSKTKQLALVPLRDVPESTPPTAPFLCASSQLWQAMPPPVNLNEGLKVSHHMTGLLTKSAPVGQFSSLLSPLVSQSLPVKVETVDKPEVRKQCTAESPNEGALTHRSLGQVRLRELPKWLACKAPSHPKDAVEMLQRGWQWYYRRYIDVRKGGVGGLGMLLAGYCVLSYIWSYRHIKLDRWRKYH
ncbi:mitochondrial nucleoid-associated protein 1 isoform X2 [Pelmatolapia mariae]|uniref:mitochondrial nucleoid-associated protein 1 isoform X2 n=1 Tax=Pelmatolapia mariae TaxID=158779 RepID=UPI002FE65744